MSFLRYFTNDQGLVDVFLHAPDRYLPFTQLMAGIMNDTSELTKPQREMIALYVSVLNDCHYCVESHKAILAGLGVDQMTVTSVKAGVSSDSSMNAVLVFTEKLTKSPSKVAQEDINALLTAGWSDQAIEDVVNVASLFSFLNRLVNGIGIEGTSEIFSQAGAMISEHGYGPVIQMVQKKMVA